MTRFIELISPRRWWGWPLGVLFWGLLASLLAYVVEIIVDGSSDDPFFKHVGTITVIAAPLSILALMLIRHLDDLQRQNAYLAHTDSLTLLPNRRSFLQDVSLSGTGAILMLDVDHFKRVNDTHGHAEGDEVLRKFADLMRTAMPPDAIMGRLGGEEFAVFLPDASLEDVNWHGAALAKGVVHPLAEGGETITVTSSVGAVLDVTGRQITAALSCADRAVYLSKNAGRARLTIADEDCAEQEALRLGPAQAAESG